MTQLVYLGTDPANHWLPGVPAADHDCPDAALAAQRIQSGLYAAAPEPPPSDVAEAAGALASPAAPRRTKGAD